MDNHEIQNHVILFCFILNKQREDLEIQRQKSNTWHDVCLRSVNTTSEFYHGIQPLFLIIHTLSDYFFTPLI